MIWPFICMMQVTMGVLTLFILYLSGQSDRVFRGGAMWRPLWQAGALLFLYACMSNGWQLFSLQPDDRTVFQFLMNLGGFGMVLSHALLAYQAARDDLATDNRASVALEGLAGDE